MTTRVATPLGEILTLRPCDVRVSDEEAYLFGGVRSFGGGVFRSVEKLGSAFSYRELTTLRADNLVYPKLMAWEGAVGLVPPECDGLVVSPEFCVFDISPSVNPRFLGYYFQQPSVWPTLAGESAGTNVRRRRLYPREFLRLRVPLPGRVAQDDVVGRLDEMLARVHEARRLKRETASVTDNFWKVLSRLARSTPGPRAELGTVAEFLDGKRIPLSEEERSTRKGPYPYYGASGIIDHIDEYIFDERLLLLSEDGANLVSRSTPIAFIASGKYWVNNHAHVLRPDPAVVDIDFLELCLADYDVSHLNFASAQAKLNQKNARGLVVPVPPLPEQRAVVQQLRQWQEMVGLVTSEQASVVEELDALEPSVLAAAFNSDL